MSCNTCKETKYNILLKPDLTNQTVDYRERLITGLVESMDFSDVQSEGLINVAYLNGSSVIASKVLRDDVSKISLKLANKHVPHEVKHSKR
jgi:hypothetical protein